MNLSGVGSSNPFCGTAGLSSGYQLTRLTGAAWVPTSTTGGIAVLTDLTLPASRREDEILPGSPLHRMATDKAFHTMTERGLDSSQQGRRRRLEDIMRELGDL